MLFATWVTALNILVFAALVAAVIYLFVLIVRAFKDAQCFFGPLGAEEFADNDEKAECRCHSDCTSGGAS